MKDDKEIKNELDRRVENKLEEKKKEDLSRKPCNCIYNHKQGEIRICMLGSDSPEEWNGNFCDEDRIAQKCPFFTPLKTKKDVEDEFYRNVKKDKYEDISVLEWVLGKDSSKPSRSLWDKIKNFFGV